MDIDELVKEVTRSVFEKLPSYASSGAAPASGGGYDASYAQYIDHTVLKPETTKATLKKFCDEAKKYHFASVCVNPVNIPFVAAELKGTGIKPCSVIGFPLGASTPFVKAAEAMEAIKNGAEEVDMVINVGALKDKDYEAVYNDILAVVQASHPRAILKVIIETCLLTDEEKVVACTLAKRAGADFVKTSTGFSTGGATVEDVKIMKQTVGESVLVKASGGVNDRKTVDAMLKAGASRIGTSKGGINAVEGDPPETQGAACQKCGKCDSKCPTGNVTITKQAY
ncbi:hypothetical protein FACS189468_4390 [Spirochaetia bacterium]|nr:hypothetical protein FACS189468_4390 [Spirochaetia bacterium]